MTEYARTNSGLILPTYIIKKPKRPIAFDFFAGAGGFSCGFMQAGFEIIGANEYDPDAAITYMVNLGSYPINIHYVEGETDKQRLNKVCERGMQKKTEENGIYKMRTSGSGWVRSNPGMAPVRNFWFGDIRKLKGKDILDALDMKQGDIDCVIGGPPCQGFSRSGKQKITDSRNPLIYEYARMIVELQPKTFAMEEVPAVVDFMDPDGVPVLDKFCLLLEEGGFGKYDALRKGIALQTGSVGLIKGQRGNITKQNRPKATQKTEKKQGEMDGQFSMDL